MSDYIDSLRKLTQWCDIVDHPSITIAQLIRGLQTNLKMEVTLFCPRTPDEAYHKALEVENLDQFYPMWRSTLSSRTPTQPAPKVSESFVSASNSKAPSFQMAPGLVPPTSAIHDTSYNLVSNVQCIAVIGEVIMGPIAIVPCLRTILS